MTTRSPPTRVLENQRARRANQSTLLFTQPPERANLRSSARLAQKHASEITCDTKLAACATDETADKDMTDAGWLLMLLAGLVWYSGTVLIVTNTMHPTDVENWLGSFITSILFNEYSTLVSTLFSLIVVFFIIALCYTYRPEPDDDEHTVPNTETK